MPLTPGELANQISRKDLETICICLLYKRMYDGLNGRVWDAGKHLTWEDRLKSNLCKHDGLNPGQTTRKPK